MYATSLFLTVLVNLPVRLVEKYRCLQGLWYGALESQNVCFRTFSKLSLTDALMHVFSDSCAPYVGYLGTQQEDRNFHGSSLLRVLGYCGGICARVPCVCQM